MGTDENVPTPGRVDLDNLWSFGRSSPTIINTSDAHVISHHGA